MEPHIGKAKADEDSRAVRGILEAWDSGGGAAGMGAGRWALGAVGLKAAKVFQKVWASARVTRAL